MGYKVSGKKSIKKARSLAPDIEQQKYEELLSLKNILSEPL